MLRSLWNLGFEEQLKQTSARDGLGMLQNILLGLSAFQPSALMISDSVCYLQLETVTLKEGYDIK